MKRILLYTAALALSCAPAMADSHALYVKDADGVHRYSFGVAGDLRLSPDGQTMQVIGYDAPIDLSKVEYMTFDMPTDGQLSSTQHKDRLLQIGEELNSKINANDAADIIGFGAEFSNLSFCDQDAFYNTFKENHPDLFEDDDYCYKLPALFKAMASIGTGNFAAARTIAATYTELFTRDDFKGVFTVDIENREWVKTANADYFEINFKGLAMEKNYSFRIETSKEYTEWQDAIVIKNEDGTTTKYNCTGRAPKTITGTVKMQNTTIFSGIVGITLNQQGKSIDITTSVNCANVKVDDVLSVKNNGVNDDLTVTIKGEKVVTNNVKFTGSELLNVADWVDAMQGIDDFDCGYHYYEMDGARVARKFGKATTHTDILGQLQVNGHAANYDKLYDDIEKYLDENDDAYERIVNNVKHTITYIYGSEYWSQKIADVINNYTDASFYYDNTDVLQGFLDWKVYEETDEWESDGYYDADLDQWVEGVTTKYIDIDYSVIPYLTFADGSTFAFDNKYFTGSNFKKLINDAEDIADIINNILSDYDYDRYEDD